MDLTVIIAVVGATAILLSACITYLGVHHAEIVQLRNDHAAQIRGLTKRINDLERLRAGDRTAIRTLTDYVRVLLQLLRDHEIEFPPPPGGLG